MAKRTDPDLTRVSARTVAKLWGVSVQAVGLWHKSGCPRRADGTYDLRSVIHWKTDRDTEAVSAASGNADSPALEEWRRQRAELAKLDLAERRGELIRVDDVRAAMEDVRAALRDESRNLIDRVQMDLGIEGSGVSTLRRARERFLQDLRQRLLALADRLDAEDNKQEHKPS